MNFKTIQLAILTSLGCILLGCDSGNHTIKPQTHIYSEENYALILSAKIESNKLYWILKNNAHCTYSIPYWKKIDNSKAVNAYQTTTSHIKFIPFKYEDGSTIFVHSGLFPDDGGDSFGTKDAEQYRSRYFGNEIRRKISYQRLKPNEHISGQIDLDVINKMPKIFFNPWTQNKTRRGIFEECPEKQPRKILLALQIAPLPMNYHDSDTSSYVRNIIANTQVKHYCFAEYWPIIFSKPVYIPLHVQEATISTNIKK